MITTVQAARVTRRRARVSEDTLTPAERRTLGGVLGFILALAALGPIAAVAGAAVGVLAARFADPR